MTSLGGQAGGWAYAVPGSGVVYRAPGHRGVGHPRGGHPGRAGFHRPHYPRVGSHRDLTRWRWVGGP